eukprot:GSMAST32.ASY1.ANO1.2594.1 assembled CDS
MGRSRASKSAGTRGFHTYSERQQHEAGTLKKRAGVDSQTPFGYCALSLHPAVNPVASPSGHIYSKEVIYKYLLNKTEELKKQRVLYEAQRETDVAKYIAPTTIETNKRISDFIADQEKMCTSAKKMARTTEEKQAEINARKRLRRTEPDKRTKKQKLDELAKSSFWLPEFAPPAKEDRVAKPPKYPESPFSGRPLRVKDLKPVTLVLDEDKNSAIPKYLCSVSQKQINWQNVILLKNTGAVILEKYFKELVEPTMKCPVTGKAFKKKHILHLQRAKSAFAGGGASVSKKWRPTR